MSFAPLPSTITVTATANALNVAQYRGDPTDLSADDKVLIEVTGTMGSTIKVADASLVGAAPQLTECPNGAFYSNLPGEYDLNFVATDNAGAVLATQTQMVRVVSTFRRYIVPVDCLVLDVNRPWTREVDDFLGMPTGRTIIHVISGGAEWVVFEVLHPENVVNTRSNTSLKLSTGIWSEATKETLNQNQIRIAFTVSMGWKTDQATGGKYKDFAADSIYVQFAGVEDKRVLCPFDQQIVFRVWDRYIPAKVPISMSAVDNTALWEMLTQANKGVSFSGTIRVRGGVNPKGLGDGTLVNVTAAPGSTTKQVIIQEYDDAIAVKNSVGDIKPKSSPALSISAPYVIDLAVLSQIWKQYTNAIPPSDAGYSLKPDPVYNWMIYDLDSRFRVVILPLAIDPRNMPTRSGKASVVPLQWFIVDRLNPNRLTKTNCTAPVTFEFSGETTDYGFVVLDTAQITKKRTFTATASNPLETQTVYTLWLKIPGNAAHPAQPLLLNGELFVTFTLAPMTTENAPSWDQWFGEANRFVSLGNYTHLLGADFHDKIAGDVLASGDALYRCAELTNQFTRYYLTIGGPENLRFHGYEMQTMTGAALQTLFWLGNGNYNACINTWFNKAQEFLDARAASMSGGWSNANFLSFLNSPTEFGIETSFGFSLGLPFGVCTAYFTGVPAFQVNRERVCLAHINNFFTGATLSFVLVLDWKGKYRAVFDRVYAGVDPTKWNYNLYGPLGVWLQQTMAQGFVYSACDAYWIGFAVNSQGDANMRIDGWSTEPYLADPRQLVAYDPTANPPQVVVDDNFAVVGSYASASKLLLGTAGNVVPGHLEATTQSQIYTADAKYAGPNRPSGLQKLSWETRWSEAFVPGITKL